MGGMEIDFSVTQRTSNVRAKFLEMGDFLEKMSLYRVFHPFVNFECLVIGYGGVAVRYLRRAHGKRI